MLGLSFKGGTDDIRESPAINVVRSLIADGCIITAYDLAAMENAQRVLPEDSVVFADNAYEAMDEADALLILTDWAEFSELDIREIKARLGSSVVLDGRNMFDSTVMKEVGLRYVSVGRPADGGLPSRKTPPIGGRKIKPPLTMPSRAMRLAKAARTRKPIMFT